MNTRVATRIELEKKPFMKCSEAQSSLADARHELDLLWAIARDLAKPAEEQEDDHSGSLAVIDATVHKLLQSVWCAEGYLEELRDWLRTDLRPVLDGKEVQP